jgi:hypothetical protein
MGKMKEEHIRLQNEAEEPTLRERFNLLRSQTYARQAERNRFQDDMSVESIEKRAEMTMIKKRVREISDASSSKKPYGDSVWKELKQMEKRGKELGL